MSVHGLLSTSQENSQAGEGRNSRLAAGQMDTGNIGNQETRDSMLRAKSSNVNKSAERISWSTGSRAVIGAKDTLVQAVSVQFGSLEPLVSRKLGKNSTEFVVFGAIFERMIPLADNTTQMTLVLPPFLRVRALPLLTVMCLRRRIYPFFPFVPWGIVKFRFPFVQRLDIGNVLVECCWVTPLFFSFSPLHEVVYEVKELCLRFVAGVLASTLIQSVSPSITSGGARLSIELEPFLLLEVSRTGGYPFWALVTGDFQEEPKWATIRPGDFQEDEGLQVKR
nr:hypothetical protein Iba_chr03aCG0300 [Ipomoea batatas]